MKDANGPEAAPARYQLADTEQEARDAVNPDEPIPGRGRDDVGGLTVDERRGGVRVEPDSRPPRQSRLGRGHPRPEIRSPGGQLAPGHSVVETEGTDSASHKALHGAAPAQGGPDSSRPLTSCVSVVSPKRMVARFSLS